MENAYKPEGYNDVSVYFIIDGAAAFAGFVKDVFTAQELRTYHGAEGKVVHAELKVGDSVIMYADANARYGPIKQVLHVYVHDVQSVYDRAISAGAKAVQAPKQMEGDPDLRGTFEDQFGNMWSVATQR